MRSNLVKDYIMPSRIVECSDNVRNAEALFTNKSEQIFLCEKNYLSCRGGGYVILDFGKEIQGGVRILSYYREGQKKSSAIRIRFGESVNETCAEIGEKNAGNYHSVRDIEVSLPDLSDNEWGKTGFRFARIDFLEPETEYRIVNVYGAFSHRDLTYKGDFQSEDMLLNDIYDTARYTVFLNMQENLLEGIKRDRLVWIGDMQPEVRAILEIFGDDPCIEKAIDLSVEKNPLPCWFGNIPTYSFWLIQIVYEYYMRVGNTDYVLGKLPYIDGVLRQLDECVTADGDIDYTLFDKADARNGYFLDWPTRDTPDAKPGNRYMFVYVLKNLKKLYWELGKSALLCDKLLEKLEKRNEKNVTAKQVVALGYLAGMIGKEEAAEKLTRGGAKGLSTYLSYFILKAIAETCGVKTAIDIMKEYYGGMLSRGATTFWEDFDVEWLQGSGRIDERTPQGLKDLHGDYGKFCYTGFRHSLCHGWSCGPVQFINEYVLGVTVAESGCKKLCIAPDLCGMTEVNGIFPTPYGDVRIAATAKDGGALVKVQAPPCITVERG